MADRNLVEKTGRARARGARASERLWLRISVAAVVTIALASASFPAQAQDEPAPVTAAEPGEQPAPAEPAEQEPALPQPETPDPLAGEGASEELDPNTPAPEPENPEDELPPCPEPGEETPADAGSEASTATTAPASAEEDAAPACKPKKRGRYANQPDFVPDSLNSKELRKARWRLAEAEEELVQVVSRVKSLRLRAKRIRAEQNELSSEMFETLRQLEETERRLRERALASFVNSDKAITEASFDHDEVLRYEAQQFIVSEIFSVDTDLIQLYSDLKDRLDAKSLALYERLKLVNSTIIAVRTEAEAAEEEVAVRRFERDVWENKAARYLGDIVFPVAGPFDYPLIDSWGYPRVPGTIDEHWHEGIDIFAPEGTPLVATEPGIVNSIGVGQLGGLRVWLNGESGARWYYAHLSAFAEGLENGQYVEAGDLLGYVGHTGNAVGTPDHLHMQVHPDAGRPINPYPILAIAAERQLHTAQIDAELARLEGQRVQ